MKLSIFSAKINSMEISIYRETPLNSEERSLPARVYNLAHSLIARCKSGVVFVPIRALKMLAILDKEEFVFVDSQYKQWAESAWKNFRPQVRNNLHEPVPFVLEIYRPEGKNRLNQLMSEFPKALQALAEKDTLEGPAKLLKFEVKRTDEPR